MISGKDHEIMRYEFSSEGDSRTVTVVGEITFREHATFRPMLKDFLEADSHHFIVDLSGVGAIDSAGLGLLLLLRKDVQNKASRLTLKTPTETVHHTLLNARFETMFTIED